MGTALSLEESARHLQGNKLLTAHCPKATRPNTNATSSSICLSLESASFLTLKWLGKALVVLSDSQIWFLCSHVNMHGASKQVYFGVFLLLNIPQAVAFYGIL